MPACISSPFGPRDGGGPRASHVHTGIDLPAPAGAWVRAAAAGTITAIRRRGSAGLEVEIRHDSHWSTRYDHLGMVAAPLLTGQRSLAQGGSIGRVGRTGITYGTHLHFEVLFNGTPIDPTGLLGLSRCEKRR